MTNNKVATFGDDYNLTSPSINEAIYGLSGDDTFVSNLIFSDRFDSGGVFVGGTGNDRYIFNGTSGAVIDLGSLGFGSPSSNNDVLETTIRFNDSNTWFYEMFDQNVLVIINTNEPQMIQLWDWKHPDSRIEQFQFADTNYSYDEFVEAVEDNNGYLGNFNNDATVNLNGEEYNITASGSVEDYNRAIDKLIQNNQALENTTKLSLDNNSITENIATEDNYYSFKGERYYYDFYTIENSSPGQIIEINLTADDFNPMIMVLDSSGNVLESDTDGSLSFSAPAETFFISVESSGANQTGRYNLNYSIGNTSTINPSVDLSGIDADIIDGNITGSQTVNGRLETTDTTYLEDGLIGYSDEYLLTGATVGETVTVRLESDVFDTYLEIVRIADDGTFTLIAEDDDDETGLGGVASNTDSTLNFTVEANFNYAIVVNSYDAGDLGAYTLTTL